MVLVGLAAGLNGVAFARPIQNAMTKHGLELLAAHLRSFDPGEPTARERLERELGAPLVQQLFVAARLGAESASTPSPGRLGRRSRSSAAADSRDDDSSEDRRGADELQR